MQRVPGGVCWCWHNVARASRDTVAPGFGVGAVACVRHATDAFGGLGLNRRMNPISPPKVLACKVRQVSAEPRISVEAAIVVTQRSRRTWWRRISEGAATRCAADNRGRTMLTLTQVQTHICFRLNPDDLGCLLRADAGDAESQNDIGQLFLSAGKPEAAVYWFKLATTQHYPDAMQCLGRCYASGEGVGKDENLSLMWIAKAAAFGHVIAQAQMNALRLH